MDKIRLQKFLADAGVASRRKGEELIATGRVSVNGTVVVAMGFKVSPEDRVVVDGKEVKAVEKKIYIMLHKPTGFITTVKDQFGRPSVMDLVKEIPERMFPVGRLDYDTSGLILLTNDGDFTYQITHPGNEMKKRYVALVRGIPTEEEITVFQQGLEIEDYRTAPAGLKILKTYEKSAELMVTIHEGRNRQVRKMCEAIGHPVLSLKRIAVGPVQLGNLESGSWRFLTLKEVEGILQGNRAHDRQSRKK